MKADGDLMNRWKKAKITGQVLLLAVVLMILSGCGKEELAQIIGHTELRRALGA